MSIESFDARDLRRTHDRLKLLVDRLQGCTAEQVCTVVCTGAGMTSITAVTSDGLLTFVASLDGIDVAHLQLEEDLTEILSISTDSAYWRQGLASALYAHAQSLLGPIAHSPYRSPTGDRWASAVGGHLPDLEHADWE